MSGPCLKLCMLEKGKVGTYRTVRERVNREERGRWICTQVQSQYKKTPTYLDIWSFLRNSCHMARLLQVVPTIQYKLHSLLLEVPYYQSLHKYQDSITNERSNLDDRHRPNNLFHDQIQSPRCN